MKDNFSKFADRYAAFRPVYPASLFSFILSEVKHRNRAWDCGTGNGQVAASLSPLFREVFATDISANQLKHAVKRPNIYYHVEDAAYASFPSDYFDLIIAAQAIHWFNFEAFYQQVNRTATQGAIFAAIGYGLPQIDDFTDRIINRFYREITGPYWDAERKYIDENYQTIPFPFKEIPSPLMSMKTLWKLANLVGYLSTWSAVQHYKNKNGNDPILLIEDELKSSWNGEETKEITFPLLLRVGRINK